MPRGKLPGSLIVQTRCRFFRLSTILLDQICLLKIEIIQVGYLIPESPLS
jgi:hypothetical protein